MATSQARPKRAAEAFAQRQSRSDKKLRFDTRNPSRLAAGGAGDGDGSEDDDDIDALDAAVLEADVVGRGAQTKRNAVNIDGYESDSEGESFQHLRRRDIGHGGDGGAAKDEEDMDIFADLENADGDEDEEAVGPPGKKKDVRFLDQREIEGQDMRSRAGGHVSSSAPLLEWEGKRVKDEEDSSSSSSEDEDEDDEEEEEYREGENEGERDERRRAKAHSNLPPELAEEVGAGGNKKHAPRLDAFNLRAEADEGKFDEDGNFVRRAADPDANNDRWLDGVRRKDVRKAKEAQERRLNAQRAADLQADALLTSDLISTLLSHLQPSETPLEALARLNKSKRSQQGKKVPRWKAKKARARAKLEREESGAMDVDDVDDVEDERGGGGGGGGGGGESRNGAGGGVVDVAERQRRAAVEAITGAADALYSRAQHDIYETEREMLLRQYKRETDEDWTARDGYGGFGGNDVRNSDDDDDDDDAVLKDGDGDVREMWEYRWSDARDGGERHGPYDAATMAAWRQAGYFGEGVEFRRVRHGGEWSRVLDLS